MTAHRSPSRVPLAVISLVTVIALWLGLVPVRVLDPRVAAADRGDRGGRGSARPVCRESAGASACGYDCAAAYGQVRCAQTPAGACLAAYGQITCWDPPDDGRSGRRPRERAACLAAYGQIACGFDCKAAHGLLRCAQTSSGACIAAYGQVTCWDPPATRGRRASRGQCVAQYGEIACGFGCAAGSGQVRCAQRADGFCMASQGIVRCTDD